MTNDQGFGRQERREEERKKRESEKEWYFGNADKERSGPYGFHEVCVLEKLFMKVLTFFMHPFAHKSFKTMI